MTDEVTEFSVAFFNLTEAQSEELFDRLAEMADIFAENRGLETPLIGAKTILEDDWTGSCMCHGSTGTATEPRPFQVGDLVRITLEDSYTPPEGRVLKGRIIGIRIYPRTRIAVIDRGYTTQKGYIGALGVELNDDMTEAGPGERRRIELIEAARPEEADYVHDIGYAEVLAYLEDDERALADEEVTNFISDSVGQALVHQVVDDALAKVDIADIIKEHIDTRYDIENDSEECYRCNTNLSETDKKSYHPYQHLADQIRDAIRKAAKE